MLAVFDATSFTHQSCDSQNDVVLTCSILTPPFDVHRFRVDKTSDYGRLFLLDSEITKEFFILL